MAHARSRDQRIGQEALCCEQMATRAVAQRKHMGNDAEVSTEVVRLSREIRKSCRRDKKQRIYRLCKTIEYSKNNETVAQGDVLNEVWKIIIRNDSAAQVIEKVNQQNLRGGVNPAAFCTSPTAPIDQGNHKQGPQWSFGTIKGSWPGAGEPHEAAPPISEVPRPLSPASSTMPSFRHAGKESLVLPAGCSET